MPREPRRRTMLICACHPPGAEFGPLSVAPSGAWGAQLRVIGIELLLGITIRPACRCGRLLKSVRSAVDDLLAEDVCVPAVLSQLAEHVKVHPAQRQRAAPVAADQVVQPQG